MPSYLLSKRKRKEKTEKNRKYGRMTVPLNMNGSRKRISITITRLKLINWIETSIYKRMVMILRWKSLLLLFVFCCCLWQYKKKKKLLTRWKILVLICPTILSELCVWWSVWIWDNQLHESSWLDCLELTGWLTDRPLINGFLADKINNSV